jgi:hypothetical protein
MAYLGDILLFENVSFSSQNILESYTMTTIFVVKSSVFKKMSLRKISNTYLEMTFSIRIQYNLNHLMIFNTIIFVEKN